METIDKEAANNTVEEEVVVTETNNDSDSPSDEEDDIDLSGKSEEELRAFALEEYRAKKRVVKDLREQAKKHRADLDNLTKTQTKEAELPANLDEIIERKVQEKVESTVKTKEMDSYSAGSTDWLYSQPWGKRFAPESAGSNDLYKKLAREAKRLVDQRIADGEPIKDKEDYRSVLALATVNVTGDATPLIRQADDGAKYEDAQKRLASGIVGGGSGQIKTKVVLTQRQREMAIASGHDPEDPTLLALYSKK